MERIPASRQNSDEIDRFLDGAADFLDMLWGFLDESSESSQENLGDFSNDDKDQDDENLSPREIEENKIFWDSQEKLLQTDSRSPPKMLAKRALNSSSECRVQLFPVQIQMEKFTRNPIRGTYKFRNCGEIEGEVRVVIELNFRAEFEMARASEEYNRLISKMPELFVGNAEKLRALIKILCAGAKKCMEDKKMHLAPWRKQKYMQAKWLGTYERTVPVPLPEERADRLPKAKISMLTFDLRNNNLSELHSTAVEVV
ncbi:hypothetical protein SLEP1_g6790 [Rubroshorea leprosula]|uniref:Uncharacterized protein n=1 Tax=Rubroshorea leprosula TaxID=152421 RepID=A0AAV5HWC4_9ROSI|nr:hypothetical protein SLEP1_g6790 [Rubroshorea leprosula]